MTESKQEIGAAPVRGSADAHDIARSRAFVDGRYRQSDAKHSFKTIFAETVDCIDFFATPGARTWRTPHPAT